MRARVLVVGGGAVGSTLAAALTLAEVPTVVLEADRHLAQRLADDGVLVEQAGRHPVRTRLASYADPSEVTGRFTLAVLAVKAPDLLAAVAPLRALDLAESYLAVGDGLLQPRLGGVVDPSRLLLGIAEGGATNLAPGHVRITADGPIVIGRPDGRRTPQVDRVRDVLLRATPQVRISHTVERQVWSKLILSSSFSGLGAVAGCTYGEVATHPLGRELAFELWAEGYAVALALGVRPREVLGVDPAELVVGRAEDRGIADPALDRLMSRVAETRPPMLQDLERGRATEVDVINGGVADAARSLGLRAPANELVRATIHADTDLGGRGPHAFAALAARLRAIRPEPPVTAGASSAQ